ncbi:MAG: MgtC/SapB family protein [Prolixibacteraceae bacterium]|nr:MgtC/SapB family protein [Prolixibacteraceae bacterium]
MDYFSEILTSTEITWQVALVRILASFFIGTLVGIERETHDQPAGLRTHILISIGATVVMLISIFIPQTFTNFQNGDPGRIAAQVVSGIGFLGAGAILKFGADVKGLTTAASIWAMAALGLAIGAGMFVIGFIGVVVILFALTVMNLFEKRVFKERTIRKVELVVKKKDSDIQALKAVFKTQDIKIIQTGFERNINEATDRIVFLVGVTRKINIQKLSENIEKQPGIVSIKVDILE